MERVLYTQGNFDLLNYGHVQFLERCFMICNKVVVSLNTDEFIEEITGYAPVMNYDERRKSLLKGPWVYDVVENIGEENSKQTIMEVMPEIIAVGSNWAQKEFYEIMGFTQDWLDKNSIILAYIPITTTISTNEIIERVKRR